MMCTFLKSIPLGIVTVAKLHRKQCVKLQQYCFQLFIHNLRLIIAEDLVKSAEILKCLFLLKLNLKF